jgi:subtilisin family serine protease
MLFRTLKDFYNRRKQPSVVNLSINGARSAALELAIDNMARRGIHMVVSAGNDNKDACLNSPSNSRHASVVGASSFDDYKSSTSNFGRCIDIYAPGEFIMTLGKSDDRQIEGSFGTSVAAPHVAGVKALLLSVNSTVTPIDLNNLIYARANRGMIFGLPTNTVNRLLYTSA